MELYLKSPGLHPLPAHRSPHTHTVHRDATLESDAHTSRSTIHVNVLR